MSLNAHTPPEGELLSATSSGAGLSSTACESLACRSTAAQTGDGECLPNWHSSSTDHQTQSDVDTLLQSLHAREAELRPSSHYLHQHWQQDGQAVFLTPHMRLLVVSWMMEVVEELHLQDSLHLAVALLDRFLSCTKAVPSEALQLLGVTCILVSAKVHEKRPGLLAKLTEMGAGCFKGRDLLRMESILLGILSFRLELPTTHQFVHLYAEGLAQVPPEVLCTALLLTELSLLDYSILAFPASCTAAAALALAYATCNQAAPPCHDHKVDTTLPDGSNTASGRPDTAKVEAAAAAPSTSTADQAATQSGHEALSSCKLQQAAGGTWQRPSQCKQPIDSMRRVASCMDAAHSKHTDQGMPPGQFEQPAQCKQPGSSKHPVPSSSLVQRSTRPLQQQAASDAVINCDTVDDPAHRRPVSREQSCGQEDSVPSCRLLHLSKCTPQQLRKCMQELLRLHAAAAWPVCAEAKALLRPVVAKYWGTQWCSAAQMVPLATLPFGLFRE